MINIGAIPRKLFFRLYCLRDGYRIRPILKELKDSQYYSPEQLFDLQWNKIKNIIGYAYNNIPYYAKLFKRDHIRPEDIKELKDFQKIPVLTKGAIRENSEDLILGSYPENKKTKKKTGGSTGVPLHLCWDHDATCEKKAAVIRHDEWAGYRPGDCQAAIWGAEETSSRLLAKIRNILAEGKILLDALSMSRENIGEFVSTIRKNKPKTLMGHAHSIYMLARFIEKNNIDDLGFKTIISTAEVLSEEQRNKIEAVFNAKVFNRYGCEELSIIASECEMHDGLHINSEGLYVETVGGDDKSPGEILITDLCNTVMPFIRYKIEDMGHISNRLCPCGRGLPLIKKIYGRTSDFLYTSEGKILSGISIMDHFAIKIPGIWQMQVIQDRIDHLWINIVKTEKFGDDSMNEFGRKVPEFFGDKMKFDISFVDEIKPTKRGKYRFAICKIPKVENEYF